MKLPTETAINPTKKQASVQPNDAQKSKPLTQANNPSATAPSNRANTLHQLNNTWAKVESSHPLSPKQTEQVFNKPEFTSDLARLTQSKVLNQQAIAELKVALTKLSTQQGIINILTSKIHTQGSQVFLTTDNKGVLQLQLPPATLSLASISAQFSNSQPAPPSLLLAVNNENTSNQKATLLNQISPPPSGTLSMGEQLNTETIKQAIRSTGQMFESKLAKQLLSQSLMSNQKVGANQTNEGKSDLSSMPQPNTSQAEPNLASRYKQVGQQLNKWVNQLTQAVKSHEPKLQQPPSNQPATTNMSGVDSSSSKTVLSADAVSLVKPVTDAVIKVAPFLNTKASTLNQSDVNQALKKQEVNSSTSIEALRSTPKQASPGSEKLVNERLNHLLDSKSWLIQSQHTLTKQVITELTNKDSFIPNWGKHSQFKTAGDLSQFLNVLISPKQSDNKTGLSLWPSNLSAQSQLQQTLQTLTGLIPDSEKDSAQSQLLRQLLNISQSLMKVQHDQIHNRLNQQFADNNQSVQFTLPYLHQNHLQWCEIEYKNQEGQSKEKDKVMGWHLILRFAQNTDESFAIESQLKQEQLNIVLWATEKDQLKNLNQQITLFRDKLMDAGFKIDSISSKHGTPERIQRPIQQSLVDVHT